MRKSYAGPEQFVGVDLARRRSVIARMDAEGGLVDCVQIDNCAKDLVAQVAKAGPEAPVAIEATYGWYWAVDALQGAGFEVHLAHPKGNASMHNRRVKTDARDATELARLLRMGDLAESWIAPPQVRGRRELVRHRHKLVKTRASVKASVHAVLAKCGVLLPLGDIFGPVGLGMLAATELPEPYASRVASQCRLIAAITTEVDLVEAAIAAEFKDDPGYRALLSINGIGPVFASVFVAEIGDVHRFATAQALASWGGSDPAALRLGRQGPPRAHHQAGLPVVALGRDRGQPADPRAVPGRQAPADHRPARAVRGEHLQGRRRPPGAARRVLHPARRARPLPGPTHSSGVVTALTRPARVTANGMTHPALRGQDVVDPM